MSDTKTVQWSSDMTRGCLVVVVLFVALGLSCALCMGNNDDDDDGLSQEDCLRLYRSTSTWVDTDFDRMIKATMNDPDSYEKRDVSLSSVGTRRVLKVEFTGRNAFGGTVRHTATGFLNLDDCTCELSGIE